MDELKLNPPAYPVAKERIRMQWTGKDGNDYIITKDGFGFCNGVCTSQPYFDQLLDYRASQKKNNITIFAGEAGVSKSCMALALGERHDPTFNIGRVHFHAKNFMGMVVELEKSGVSDIYALLDEPQQSASAREWMKDVNQLLVKMVESFRFLQVHLMLSCISPEMIDVNLREKGVAHFLVWVTSRGSARVYRYFGTPFEGKMKTKRLGDLLQFYPSLPLWKAYEMKRRRFQAMTYESYFREAEAKEGLELETETIFDKVMANPSDYMDLEGKLLVGRMCRKLKISLKKAYMVKADVEDVMRRKMLE